MLAAVNNKPCSPRDDPSAFATIFSPPETWPSALTRHNFLISSIFFSVVKSLFAILSIRSLPLAASRRSPLTVIPPRGKPYLSRLQVAKDVLDECYRLQVVEGS